MKNIYWLSLNIFKVNFRKKITIVIFFILPVCGFIFSFFTYGRTNIGVSTIAVVDLDHSSLSQDVIQSLHEGSTGRLKIAAVSGREIKTKIISGEIDCAVIIPAGFAKSIYNGHTPKIDLVSVKGEAATAWMKQYLHAVLASLQDIGDAAAGRKEIFTQIYDRYQREHLALAMTEIHDQTANKEMTTQNIGFLIMLMLFGIGNTSELILSEKRNRTFHRICAAPVTARMYLLSNVVANLLIVMIQVCLALLVMTKIFGIITYVPFIQLFAVLVLFGLVAIALGLFVVSFSSDTSRAITLQNLIVVPTCLLTGCLWPLEIMPKAIQRIAEFLPQRWAIAAIQKLQEGAGFSRVLVHLSIIIAFALALFFIAAYRFRYHDEIKTFI
jgi:ABC-type multidrug transport system, permease component